MHDFYYKKNALYCEDTRVSAVAKAVGTPFYLYSYKTLTEHLLKIQEAFSSIKPLICYALKANDNLAVIKSLVNLGAGCDIVSGGELEKALKANTDPQKIVFASVGKTDQEIQAAIRAGILFFNVESAEEIEQINLIAKRMRKKAAIALRVNPDVEAATHEKITTGTLKNKFGIDFATARRIILNKNLYPWANINGLHMHIGSQITSAQPYITALTKILDFLDSLGTNRAQVEYLDIGGGMGIIYKDESPQTAKDFANAILPLLKKSGLKIIMEPGRFIVGNAGIFVTRMLYLKDNGFKKFLIVDGGMNDLIRPALYGAYHEIIPVQKSVAPRIKVDIVGPICESSDTFGRDRELPQPQKGDLLAIMSAGAYGYVMASNYNVRCRVPEVMVKGKTFAIVKERETLRDLMRGEKIPDFLKTRKQTQ